MIFPKSKLILAFIAASAMALLGACGGADPASPSTPVPAATSAPAPSAPVAAAANAAAPATPVPAATSAPAPSAPVPAATSTPVPPTPFPTAVPERLEVVTTTAFVADWVENVGGDRVDVTSLVPRNVDPHTFNPGARDVARVADADLIFGIGLTLEDGWLIDLIQNAARAPDAFIALGDYVEPIEFGEGMHDDHDDEHEDEHDHEEGEDHDEDEHDHEEGEDHDEDEHDHEEGEDHDEDEHDHEEGEDHDEDEEDHEHEEGEDHDEDEHEHEEGEDHDEDHEDHEGDEHEDEHDHVHGDFDPHFWFDPIRVGLAVDEIAARMSALDAANADFFAANAAAYNVELAELDGWIHERVEEIPAANRKLATSHDALGYFALHYGFEIIGTVIPGGGTEIEPSAQDVAALIERIRSENVKAVFTETTVSDRLTRRVAEEAGAKIINDLYTGGMSDVGEGAGTYLNFIRYNTSLIVDALK